MSIDSIIKAVSDSGTQHVVLTGGEPLVPDESVDLCRELRGRGMHLTIETAGTIDREIESDLMSISPKFASSAPDALKHPRWNHLHHQRRMPIGTIRGLIERSIDYQLKFVVDSKNDFDELIQIVGQLQAHQSDVWVMPQGSTMEAMDQAIGWLKPWCDDHGFVYCDRQQIRWYGNRRGT